MVQKKYSGGCVSILIGAGKAVQGVIPQGMSKRSSVSSYLMARSTTDTAARKGQAHAVKLRIFVKRGQMQLWPVKIEQGEKFCPTRAARIAFRLCRLRASHRLHCLPAIHPVDYLPLEGSFRVAWRSL